MDQYYKLERAAKEITRLNIEIRRLVTHICDEEVFLRREEARVREECGEALAHQVYHYRIERGHSDGDHIMRLTALTKLPGFTGTVSPGTAINKEHLDIRTMESEGAETLGAPSALQPTPLHWGCCLSTMTPRSKRRTKWRNPSRPSLQYLHSQTTRTRTM
jgi:hypothetical protein